MGNLMLIEKWKQETVERVVQDVIACAEEANELINQYGNSAFVMNKDGCASDWILTHPSIYRQLRYKVHDSVLNDAGVFEVKRLVDHKFKTLQAKVKKRIGEILEIQPLGGDDYHFKGELGTCTVEVILAGGYNIQRLHTRWIIK